MRNPLTPTFPTTRTRAARATTTRTPAIVSRPVVAPPVVASRIVAARIVAFPVVAALALCLAGPAAVAQTASLPPGPGRETVEAACVACHSLSYIPMNSPFLPPETWKAEVTKMRVAFGAPIDDDAAKVILEYLVARFGAPPKP